MVGGFTNHLVLAENACYVASNVYNNNSLAARYAVLAGAVGVGGTRDVCAMQMPRPGRRPTVTSAVHRCGSIQVFIREIEKQRATLLALRESVAASGLLLPRCSQSFKRLIDSHGLSPFRGVEFESNSQRAELTEAV